ncbi:MAG: hypothetical protein EKK31_05340 [Hyphomicrobiales bacterium]|jgi:hypothetical protein|nr:MAG: hypothetical protein EKK31_05340 [Hyphomicrobiales bacterium]
MPIYTVETTYHLPVYRQRSYKAATPEQACRLAIDDDRWGDAKEDVDTSSETYVTGIWKGRSAAYSGPEVPVPDAFGETVQRKAELFDNLVAILREPRPLGLSQHEFEQWLPRAVAVLAKADAITGSPAASAP